jgi:lipopolysaccharide assembly outer membrane protein LptD (OstA)
MKNRIVFPLLCFLSLFAAALYAQEDAAAAQETPLVENAAEREPLSPEKQRIEMEIKTSTLSELALWSRTLGLSEGGTREELSKRLRDYFELSGPVDNADDGRKIITIESAQTTEYFTIEVIDEDYARLRGDVRLSLKDGNTLHRISANEILFNRTRNIITARGQVVYEKDDGDTIETFRGENITVNIDNWASIFLDGNTRRELGSDGTAYLFSGAVISRNDEDVTILNDAHISSGTNEEALWSIKATKIWLLPGSDFAIFNAVLKVGEIPVLYIPFFFYPADEVFFHPVIGYRSREGGFVQTTTYILGQPKADPSEVSSLTRILGNSNDMEKELQGLFLRSTGKVRANPDEISLRALIDYYVNLGTYFGLELSLPKTGILNPLAFSIGLGFSRTIALDGGNYTPYAPNYDGTFDWNKSNLFSATVPFRYSINFNSSISSRYGALSWDIPLYSDPYIKRDFMTRSESMDWLNMLQQGIVDESSTENEQSSPRWSITGNLTPSFPGLAPWISRISISNLSTTLGFKRLNNASASAYSPDRVFFAPDVYTIYSFSGSVAGTPLSIGGQRQSSVNTTVQEAEDPLNGIGIPVSPWANDSAPAASGEARDKAAAEIIAPPVLSQSFELPAAGNTTFSIEYLLTPISSTELQFMSGNDHWKTYEDVDWSDVQSILTSISGNGNISFNVRHSRDLFSSAVSFFSSGAWREYTFLNEEADAFLDSSGDPDPDKIQAARRQQYGRTNYSASYSYNGTLRPFYEDPIFNQSNLEYSFRGTLVNSRKYTDGDGPELRPVWGAWVKENRNEDIFGLTSHQFSTKFAANIMDKLQEVSVSVNLPPLDGLISTNAAFRFWISTTSLSFRVERPEGSGEWIYKPLTISEVLNFNKTSSLSYNMTIDPGLSNEVTAINTTLKLWGNDFTAEFNATRTTASVFVTDPAIGGKWEPYGEPTLLPKDLKFAYNHLFSNMEIIRNRMNISFNINTSLTFDLQRHTNSNFQLTLGCAVNIAGFLELTLAATSSNAVIFRYFKDVPGMEDLTWMYIDGPQNNLFVDLFDSFNFFDNAKRRRSGFKMQTFSFSAVHFLGDWTAELKIDMYPYRHTGSDRFEIVPDISFAVRWRPISEIKSELGYTGKDNRWLVK